MSNFHETVMTHFSKSNANDHSFDSGIKAIFSEVDLQVVHILQVSKCKRYLVRASTSNFKLSLSLLRDFVVCATDK